jgi:tetratricopeptide (TPR) repeat protein
LALGIAERDGPGSPDAIITLRSLGQVYDATDKFAEAEEVFQRRLRLADVTWANNASMLCTVYDDLAFFYIRHKRYEDAKPIYDRAIKIRQDAFGESSPDVVSTLKLYASLLRLGGEDGEANQMTERANGIKARQGASPSQR